MQPEPESVRSEKAVKQADAEKEALLDELRTLRGSRAKDSQLHYAGRRDRARRARITMML